jgi:hypothetical protein
MMTDAMVQNGAGHDDALQQARVQSQQAAYVLLYCLVLQTYSVGVRSIMLT